MDTVSLKNLLKFVVGTLLGLFLVVIPLNFGKNEMYPLYWTPSKEGTFCVIRLNLS